MKRRLKVSILGVLGLFGLLVLGCGPHPGTGTSNDNGNSNSNGNSNANSNSNQNQPPDCSDGTDADHDGYGEGCPAGPDCNDDNNLVHPGAEEICNGVDDNCDGATDEDVLTDCGNCSEYCTTFDLGTDPFPMPENDSNAEANGVNLDPNGDLILDQTNVNFNFLWIANCQDLGQGTVSKVDTDNVTEVARYLTVTCFGNPAFQNGQCLDVAGNPIQTTWNMPSRTAVDYNFDVWVANRAFCTDTSWPACGQDGQPSVTRIANDTRDCVDRNGNGKIDTSSDQNGNGVIDVDCDGNSQADDGSTVCTNGLPPEYLGLDDECVLFTVNYANPGEWGRSVCLDAGDPYNGGPGNVWVGTNHRLNNNRFYKINGATGSIVDHVDLAPGIDPYGCTVDGQGILWTVGGWYGGGRLSYFDTADLTKVGPVLEEPYTTWNHFYGLGMDSAGSIWIGGWDTQDVFRYRPDRTNFSTLPNGAWTRVRTHEEGNIANTRGIAADLRGWIWVASNNGYIVRLPQNIGDNDWSWAAVAQLSAERLDVNLGSGMVGVGIDFAGNVWGMSHDQSTATRIDLNSSGDPVNLTTNVFTTAVGLYPYTYSDFTGYGLRNFTRPEGTYRYVMEGCGESQETHWLRVEWNATTPPGTSVRVRVRVGDDPQSLGAWFGPWDQSPAVLTDPPEGPVLPDPARFIQVEFELMSDDQETTPVVHDYKVIWDCGSDIPG